MTPQVEEIVVPSNLFEPKDRAPGLCYVLLHFTQGVIGTTNGVSNRRIWQRLAVHLAVGRQGDRLQRHEVCGHHELREPSPHLVPQPAVVQGIDAAIGRGHVVGDKFCLASGTVANADDAVCNAWSVAEDVLDLFQLDAESPDLDLMIEASKIFDVSIRQVAGQIARLVEPRCRVGTEGVADEPGGRQIRPVVVAPRQTDAADVQFARHADGEWRHLRIEDIQRRIGDGAADRYAGPVDLFRAGPRTHVDGGFGGAIQIVQLGGQDLPTLVGQFHTKGLTTADDLLEARRLLDGLLAEENLQHRGNEVDRGDLILLNPLSQVVAVEMPLRFGDDQCGAHLKGPEELPDGHIETVWCLLQHAVGGPERIGVLHPEQAIANTQMGVHNALGPARGA